MGTRTHVHSTYVRICTRTYRRPFVSLEFEFRRVAVAQNGVVLTQLAKFGRFRTFHDG